MTCDNNGNMLSGPLLSNTTVTYTYDARNRLISAGGVTYLYDMVGTRTGYTVGGCTTTFVVDPNAVLSKTLMRTTPGNVTTYYVYGGSGLLYETSSGGSITTYHYDQIGSTSYLVDSTGNTTTDHFEYTPYGAISYRTGSTDTPFQYNGAFGVMTDPNNGLLNMRARFYDPFIRRFVNADPGGFGGGMNFYAYADGNPVSETDPFGLSAEAESGGGVGDVLNAAIDGGNRYAGAVVQSAEFWNWPQQFSNMVGSNAAAAIYDTQNYFSLANNLAGLEQQFSTPEGLGQVAGGLLTAAVGGEAVAGVSEGSVSAAAPSADNAAENVPLDLGAANTWGRADTLADHFARHGADFGSTSAEDYANQASEFFQTSQAQGLPTKIDSTGVIRTYDPSTNSFGAFNPDGTTRTYFKPTSPNYFQNQPGTVVP